MQRKGTPTPSSVKPFDLTPGGLLDCGRTHFCGAFDGRGATPLDAADHGANVILALAVAPVTPNSINNFFLDNCTNVQ